MMTNSDIKHYLLVVDRLSSTSIESLEFSNVEEATNAYHQAEQEYGSRPGYDVVLIGSDSIETVQQTHRSYFLDSEPFSRLAHLVERARSLTATEFEDDRQRWQDVLDKIVTAKKS